MKKVILTVYWHTPDTSKFQDLEIEFNLEDCTTRQVTFYQITAVSDYVEEGKIVGTRIHIPGDTFLSPLNREEVEKKIEEAFKTTY